MSVRKLVFWWDASGNHNHIHDRKMFTLKIEFLFKNEIDTFFNILFDFAPFLPISGNIMVLILDGNSEIGAHVRSSLSCLNCLRHLIK